MTSARYNQLKAGAAPLSAAESAEFESTMTWERRSQAAHRAVKTKQKKYTKWPNRNNDHQRKV